MTKTNDRVKKIEDGLPDELDQIAMRDTVFGISKAELALLEQAKKFYDEYGQSAYDDMIAKPPYSDLMQHMQLLYDQSLERQGK